MEYDEDKNIINKLHKGKGIIIKYDSHNFEEGSLNYQFEILKGELNGKVIVQNENDIIKSKEDYING